MPTYLKQNYSDARPNVQYAVTGVIHGTYIWAKSDISARFIFHRKYPQEEIIEVKVIQNFLF